LDRVPITQEGYDTLKKELEHLKTVDRPNVIQAIEEARAHGDLSENAEYDAAKNRQSFIEGRIGELAYKLAQADIIDPATLTKDRAVFGCRIELENIETGECVTYLLVGPDESDIEKGRISFSSPLGKAMVGKQIGEEVVFQAPGGKRLFEVINIF